MIRFDHKWISLAEYRTWLHLNCGLRRFHPDLIRFDHKWTNLAVKGKYKTLGLPDSRAHQEIY